MKKTFLILLVLLGLINTLTAQETIPMPTQAEWDSYIEKRIKGLQVTIFNLAIEGKITIYKTNLLEHYPVSPNSIGTLNPNELRQITSGITIKDSMGTYYEISTPINPEKFDGLCFSEQQDSNLGGENIHSRLSGIALLMHPWLVGGIRDINAYPICWFSKKS